MHTKRIHFRKRIILLLFVLLLSIARSNPVWAIDTITVEPVNMVDIQVVDEQGNLLDSAYVRGLVGVGVTGKKRIHRFMMEAPGEVPRLKYILM